MNSVSISVDVPDIDEGVRFFATDTRRSERHWTPVHLDIHVDDLRVALKRALAAGAKQEQWFEDAEHGSAAFCSDPFGHGFCLIQRRK